MIAPADTTPLREALEELYAVVKGECPSLLNEDSGGDARLDMAVRAALASEPVAGTGGRDEIARILNDHFWTGEPGQHDAIKSATEALSALDGWYSADSLPPTKPGQMKEYVIAVYRDHSKKVYSFACSYLNAWPLEYQDECPKGAGCCPTTGWFILTGDGDNESGSYQELSIKDGDKIMGWRDIPQWEGPVVTPQGDRATVSTPGWKLVPIEPTREMWAAGADAVVGKTILHHDHVVAALYSAMLTAAPATPPAPGAADRAVAFCEWLQGYFAGDLGKEELTAFEANQIRAELNERFVKGSEVSRADRGAK